MVDRAGRMVVQGEAALTQGGAWLKAGKILAVKGVGGFHLTCDARNATAIAELRHRKGRPAKPLAVMARDLQAAEAICRITAAEAQLLLSSAAPIVLLSIRPEAGLPSSLAPGLNAVGVMLPYTELYHQLLSAGPDVIVCTSGNKTGLPTAKDDQQALAELGQIADYFLLHDGNIQQRCDDTVTFVVAGQPRFIRRSRGYYSAPDMEGPCQAPQWYFSSRK